MFDLTITQGVIVSSEFTGPATIAIKNGKIQALLAPNETVSSAKTINAPGMLIMPGAIDIHIHCRAPSFPERGDFASESRAAAAGGVTTIFEMPISDPCAATTDVFKARRDLAAKDAHVNIGLYAAPGLLDKKEIQGMVKAGAIGFKLFMTAAVKGREKEFAGLTTNNMADITQALELIKETGLRCVFHAEDQSLINLYTTRVRGVDMVDYKRHLRSRPHVVEVAAVASLLAVAEALQVPVHIAHVSARQSLDLIRLAKDKGVRVSAETCPHYLFFDETVLERVGPFGKINPPIRTQEDRLALWEALKDGTLDVVATDHAPFRFVEKDAAWGNILDALPGHPGLEQFVPLMLSEALTGRIGLQRCVELISAIPAQLFNLPTKGSFRPGADADITIYNPEPHVTIDRHKGFSRAAESNWLYDGMTLQGEVHATILAGKLIYNAGEMLAKAGDGAIVTPQHSKPLLST